MAHARNIGVTTETVQIWVKKALKKKRDNGTLKLPVPKMFDDLIPQKGWVDSFIKRHNISRRVPEIYSKARNKVTYEEYLQWFAGMKAYLADNNWEDILQDPSRNFNCDESGITLEDKPKKVSVCPWWLVGVG